MKPSEEFAWFFGRPILGGSAALATRLRSYGTDRIPHSGGVVLAFNHFSWIDIPCVGWACKRNLYFLAKNEAHVVPGLGPLIRSFGTLSVRRGESDRDAVRRMREVVRDGNALGVFVEGTRQRSGVPGHVQPGAAMAALQEGVPVVCARSTARRTGSSATLLPSRSHGESRCASTACRAAARATARRRSRSRTS